VQRFRSVLTLNLQIVEMPFYTFAVQAAVLYEFTNIFVAGRLRLSCVRSREVYVLTAVSAVSAVP